VRGEPLGCTFPTIAHRVKLYQKIRQELAFFRASFFVQSDSAVQLRRAWEKHVQAARPSPHPLPARAQMGRATSCDTRGEGAPAVALYDAAARCVHPLGLQSAGALPRKSRSRGRSSPPTFCKPSRAAARRRDFERERGRVGDVEGAIQKSRFHINDREPATMPAS
jgi:hypothetical protein